MKKTLAFTSLLSICALFVNGQDKKYARSIIDTLSSEHFHGRGYVDNGDGLAAQYIANIFDTLGLEKVGNSYFQEFNVSVNTFPKAVKIVIDKTTLEPGIDFLIEPGSPSVRGKYDLQFVTKEELEKPNDFLSTLKSGEKKFLVFPLFDAQNKAIQDLINFLKYEPSSPVDGIIQMTDKKLTWYGATFTSQKPHIIIDKSVIDKNAKHISLNIKSEFIEEYKTQNVIGKLKGKSDSIIVITAHYDHLGRMGKDTYFPGANDNASGTAFLLDMARHYNSKDSLPYTMVFIAFAAEEIGLLGSRHFVENPTIQLQKIKFLLNFDLAGTGDDGIQVVNGSVYQSKFELLQKINSHYELLPEVKIRGTACNSDHCHFYEKGVPGFFIYTLGGITAYHDINDKASTLPLTEYEDYFLLMSQFIDALD